MSITALVRGWKSIVDETTREALKPEILKRSISVIRTSVNDEKDEIICKIVDKILDVSKQKCLQATEFSNLKAEKVHVSFNPGLYRGFIYQAVSEEVNSLIQHGDIKLKVPENTTVYSSIFGLFARIQLLISNSISRYS